MSKLVRLYDKILNKPHLISKASFNVILDYLESRKNNVILSTEYQYESFSSDESPYELVTGGLAVIPVHGAVTYKPIQGECGEVDGVSYAGLIETVSELAEKGVNTIVFDFACPGGEASHAFSTAEQIVEICNQFNIHTIAYVDEYAYSAGYLMACICDEVIVHPSASVGSIGAIVCAVNDSEAWRNAGYKRYFISEPEGKSAYADNGDFKQEFLDELYKEVSELSNQFYEHVNKYTGISVEEIKAMNAKTFNATDALRMGLCNSVMNHIQFSNYIKEGNYAGTA